MILLLPSGAPQMSQGKLTVSAARSTINFFQERIFSFERLSSRKVMVIWAWLFGRFSLKCMHLGCHFREINSHYLMPMMKFKL